MDSRRGPAWTSATSVFTPYPNTLFLLPPHQHSNPLVLTWPPYSGQNRLHYSSRRFLSRHQVARWLCKKRQTRSADPDPVLARRYVTQVLNFNEVSDPSSRALLVHGNHPYVGWAFKPKVPTPFSGFAPLFSSHAVSKQTNQ